MFNRFLFSFVCCSKSRRHRENKILEKHRFFRNHRERNQSNNCQNRLEHRLERERNIQSNHKNRSFAHHARRQVNFQSKSSSRILFQAF